MKIKNWLNKPIFTGWMILLSIGVIGLASSSIGFIAGLATEDHYKTEKDAYAEGWKHCLFQKPPKYKELDAFEHKYINKKVSFVGFGDEGNRQTFEGLK